MDATFSDEEEDYRAAVLNACSSPPVTIPSPLPRHTSASPPSSPSRFMSTRPPGGMPPGSYDSHSPTFPGHELAFSSSPPQPPSAMSAPSTSSAAAGGLMDRVVSSARLSIDYSRMAVDGAAAFTHRGSIAFMDNVFPVLVAAASTAAAASAETIAIGVPRVGQALSTAQAHLTTTTLPACVQQAKVVQRWLAARVHLSLPPAGLPAHGPGHEKEELGGYIDYIERALKQEEEAEEARSIARTNGTPLPQQPSGLSPGATATSAFLSGQQLVLIDDHFSSLTPKERAKLAQFLEELKRVRSQAQLFDSNQKVTEELKQLPAFQSKASPQFRPLVGSSSLQPTSFDSQGQSRSADSNLPLQPSSLPPSTTTADFFSSPPHPPLQKQQLTPDFAVHSQFALSPFLQPQQQQSQSLPQQQQPSPFLQSHPPQQSRHPQQPQLLHSSQLQFSSLDPATQSSSPSILAHVTSDYYSAPAVASSSPSSSPPLLTHSPSVFDGVRNTPFAGHPARSHSRTIGGPRDDLLSFDLATVSASHTSASPFATLPGDQLSADRQQHSAFDAIAGSTPPSAQGDPMLFFQSLPLSSSSALMPSSSASTRSDARTVPATVTVAADQFLTPALSDITPPPATITVPLDGSPAPAPASTVTIASDDDLLAAIKAKSEERSSAELTLLAPTPDPASVASSSMVSATEMNSALTSAPLPPEEPSAVVSSEPPATIVSDASAAVPLAPPLAPPLDCVPLAPPPPCFGAPPPPAVELPLRHPKPTVPLKHIHWNKLKHQQVVGTIFADILDPPQPQLIEGELKSNSSPALGPSITPRSSTGHPTSPPPPAASSLAAAVDIEFAEMEKHFYSGTRKRDQNEAAPSATSRAGRKKADDSASLSLPSGIDVLRAQNAEISLSRLKLSPDAIRDALLLTSTRRPLASTNASAITSTDDDEPRNPLIYSVDSLEILSKVCPTDEECGIIAKTRRTPEQLPKVHLIETLFRTLLAVPRVKRRVELLLFRLESDALLRDIGDSLMLVEAATAELKSSHALRYVLKMVLAAGNFLNSQTSNLGGAWGFRLSLLGKLNATKTADGKLTLIHWLILELEQQRAKWLKASSECDVGEAISIPSSIDDAAASDESNQQRDFVSEGPAALCAAPPTVPQLLTELAHVQQAAQIDSSAMSASLQSIKSKINSITQEVKLVRAKNLHARSQEQHQAAAADDSDGSRTPTSSSTVHDGFADFMSDFLASIESQYVSLQARFEAAVTACDHLARYFAETEPIRFESLFAIFAGFLSAYATAERDVRTKNLRAKKQLSANPPALTAVASASVPVSGAPSSSSPDSSSVAPAASNATTGEEVPASASLSIIPPRFGSIHRASRSHATSSGGFDASALSAAVETAMASPAGTPAVGTSPFESTPLAAFGTSTAAPPQRLSPPRACTDSALDPPSTSSLGRPPSTASMTDARSVATTESSTAASLGALLTGTRGLGLVLSTSVGSTSSSSSSLRSRRKGALHITPLPL